MSSIFGTPILTNVAAQFVPGPMTIHHLLPGGSAHHLVRMLPFFADVASELKPAETHFVLFGGKRNETRDHFDRSGENLDNYPCTFRPRSDLAIWRFLLATAPHDIVVLHSTLTRHLWPLLLSLPKLWPRLIWMDWGAGVAGPYARWRNLKSHQVLSRLWFWSFRTVVPRLAAVGTVLPEEKDHIAEMLGKSPRFARIQYSSRAPDVPLYTRNADGSVFRILLGNSASASNRHLEAIDLMRRFSQEPIEVVCPLGYSGEPAYRDRVVRHGMEVLGSKFRPLLQRLPLPEYRSLWNTMDIHVQNAQVQYGMANIGYMMRSGRKVFVNPLSPAYEHYTKNGATVFTTNDLAQLPFASVSEQLPRSVQEQNQRVCENLADVEGNRRRWIELLRSVSLSSPEAGAP